MVKQSEILTQLVNVLEQDLYFVELWIWRFQFQTSTSRGKGRELFKIKVEILTVLETYSFSPRAEMLHTTDSTYSSWDLPEKITVLVLHLE